MERKVKATLAYLLTIATTVCFGISLKPGRASESAISGDASIFLEGGVWNEDDARQISPRNIELDFVCENGTREKEVWGYANFYNRFGNDASEFFVLMNVQKGTAPAVKVEGEGGVAASQWRGIIALFQSLNRWVAGAPGP